jgi:hypothetical protein
MGAPARLRVVRENAERSVAAADLENGAQTVPTEVLGADYELLVSPSPPPPGAFEDPLAKFALTLQGDLSYAVGSARSPDGRSI